MNRNALVENNWKLAPTFARPYIGRGIPMEDLCQLAVLGIIRAAEDFNDSIGKFSTYAGLWARKIIRDSLRHQRIVDVPDNMVDIVVKYKHAEKTLRQEYGRQPTYEEIVATLQLTTKQSDYCRYLGNALATERTVSAQTPIGEDNEIGDIIPDIHDNDSPELTDISVYLSALPDRDAEIMKMRYGIGYPVALTQSQVGEALGITKQAVSLIENNALKTMRTLITTVCSNC